MSFVHGDQENHPNNIRKLRSGTTLNTLKDDFQASKRAVLGIINVDNVKVAGSKLNKKDASRSICGNVRKPKSTVPFSVYEDAVVSTTIGCTSTTSVQEDEICSNESPSKKFKDNCDPVFELPIPSKLIPANLQIRQPFKDVLDTSASSEEESLSGKSFVASPMSVDRTLSPISRPSKSMLKKLYDCDTYSEEILNYLKSMEKLHRPKPNYMRRQPDLTYVMRTILVNWLVEVAEEYKLQSQTLFLAVSFIDRFLSLMSVVKSKIQLLGTAAMFVASKYEEIYPPDVSEFVFITDDSYSQKQVLRMEYLILKVLAFDISGPTVIVFLQHFSVVCDIPEKVMYLAMYLGELVLLEGDPYLAFHESIIASSALLVARHCLEYVDVWPASYVKSIGYEIHDLKACLIELQRTHANSRVLQQQAVNIKFNANKYLNVASVKPRPLYLTDEEKQLRLFKLNAFSNKFS